MKKIISILIFTLIFTCVSFAASITKTYYFDEPVLTPDNIFTRIEITEGVVVGTPGYPALPYRGISLLIPQNENITNVLIEKGNEIYLGGHIVYPIQRPVPLSDTTDVGFTEPDPDIYGSSEPFPAKQNTDFRTHYLAGYSIGSLAITPFSYIPVTGELYYFESITVTVETAFNEAAETAANNFLFENDPVIDSRLQILVENYEDKDTFYNPTRTRPNDEYRYTIVTAAAYVDDFQPLADFHAQQGYLTEIVLIEDILSSYGGVDDADKLRNYFKYEDAQDPFKYVLLGGDTNIIPYRGLYGIVNAGGPTEKIDYDIPADMYYACLNGTWDEDEDGIWGEAGNIGQPEEADFLAEFYIARICFNSHIEIANFINKTIMYSETPVLDELQSALLVGELLCAPPFGTLTYGGWYMDELIGFCDTHYPTTGIPTNWNISKLYEEEFDWTFDDIKDSLSQGPNLLNHMGHSGVQRCMQIYNYQLTTGNITNNGVNHNFINGYTQGCYAGSFDNRTPNGNHPGDCFAEKITTMETGAVTFVANSRYGWYRRGSTNGPSQRFHRHWMDTFFGDNIFSIAAANQISKEKVIPWMSAVKRWCYYELNVFGDPAVELLTEPPYPTVIISGYVHDEYENRIHNVKMNFSNGTYVMTDISGYYSKQVIEGWSGMVTPEKGGYEFDPPFREYVEIQTDYFNQNYIGHIYQGIEGIIALSGSSGNIEDIKVGAGGQIVYPNSEGIYLIPLSVGEYNVTAYLSGYMPQTIEDVEVIEGEITAEIDFNLEEGFVIYVNQDGIGDYTTIQEGINAANDGNTVLVADGSYSGINNTTLTWDGNEKHLVVKSENGPEDCTIDGENGGAFDFPDVNVNCTQDTIQGFMFINSPSPSICGDNSSPAIIFNIFVNCYSSVAIKGDQEVSVKYNEIMECTCGIECNSPGLIAYNTLVNCSNCSDNHDAQGGGIYATNPGMVILENQINSCHSNTGGGIYAGDANVYNNIIEDCTVIGLGGAGIYGGQVISGNNIRNCSAYCVEDDTGIWGGSGGGIFVQNTDATISNNTLEYNYSESEGAAISLEGGSGHQIINNDINNNTLFCDATANVPASGISCNDCDYILIEGNEICYGNSSLSESAAISLKYCDESIIRKNLVCNNTDAGIAIDVTGNIEIVNCTIHNNSISGIWVDDTSGPVVIRNLILTSNIESGIIGNDITDIVFSDVWNNGYDGQQNYINCTPGVGCIELDPLFEDPSNSDYSLTWKIEHRSPCIDTGDPETEWDADNTPPDMGAVPAIPHNYDCRTLTADRWNWFSFPVLDTLTELGTDALNVLAPILDPDILTSVKGNVNGGEVEIIWNGYNWVVPPGMETFQSIDGYKIQMITDAELPISGFLEDPDIVFLLEADNENWIGYFLPYSQAPEDAFASIWNNLTFIKADSWAFLWVGDEIPRNRLETVDYGKLYIVGVKRDCIFTWGDWHHPKQPYERTMPELFTYEEEADYMPVFVDSTEAVAGIDEIGVFLGDECISASKIEGFPVFIPAYIEDEDSTGNKDYNELTFQVASYGKSGKRSIPAFIYNETQDAFVEEPVILDAKSYAIVRLGTGEGIEFPREFTLYQNYPNPIRSYTKISFIPAPGVNKSEIKIYNIKGQLVNTIITTNGKSPITNVIWNGKDKNGKFMANGIYFYKLTSGDKSEMKKMVILR